MGPGIQSPYTRLRGSRSGWWLPTSNWLYRKMTVSSLTSNEINSEVAVQLWASFTMWSLDFYENQSSTLFGVLHLQLGQVRVCFREGSLNQRKGYHSQRCLHASAGFSILLLQEPCFTYQYLKVSDIAELQSSLNYYSQIAISSTKLGRE